MRVAHSRTHQGVPVWKGQYFDRVVTTVWEINQETNILQYAAAVFRRDEPSEEWDKRLHRNEAIWRFRTCPVSVQLWIKPNVPADFSKLNWHAVDWYIATVLVPLLGGTSRKNSADCHVMTIFEDYNKFNDQFTHFKDKLHDRANVHHDPEFQNNLVSSLTTKKTTSAKNKKTTSAKNKKKYYMGTISLPKKEYNPYGLMTLGAVIGVVGSFILHFVF